MAFAPDQPTLATGSRDGTLMMWDVTNRTRPRQLGPPLTGHTDAVTSVAFAPDGRTLATGSADRTAILWDLDNASRPRRLGPPLTGHTDAVTSVAFAPGGLTFGTRSVDGTVILWDLIEFNALRSHPVEYACTHTQRSLNHAEWARYIPGLPYEKTCPN